MPGAPGRGEDRWLAVRVTILRSTCGVGALVITSVDTPRGVCGRWANAVIVHSSSRTSIRDGQRSGRPTTGSVRRGGRSKLFGRLPTGRAAVTRSAADLHLSSRLDPPVAPGARVKCRRAPGHSTGCALTPGFVERGSIVRGPCDDPRSVAAQRGLDQPRRRSEGDRPHSSINSSRIR